MQAEYLQEHAFSSQALLQRREVDAVVEGRGHCGESRCANVTTTADSCLVRPMWRL